MVILIIAFSWETVDPGNCGMYSSIAASGDTLFVSYYDIDDGDLKYAWKVGTTWNTYVIDATGVVGKFTSICVYNGTVWISYYDETNNNLKCAYGRGTSFTVETVDNTANVGGYSSIVVKDGIPHIFYYDYTNGDLKHTWKVGSTWSIEAVDVSGDVGQWTSSVVGPDGNIYVSYYDYTNDDLKMAVLSTSWSTYSIDDGGTCTSIDVALDGTIHIAYASDTGTLKHAWGIPGNWNFEIVDNTLNSGNWISIELDRYGNPLISYTLTLDLTPYLCIARYNGTGWDLYSQIDTVAGDGGTSITIMGDDVYTSYYRGNPEFALRVMTYPGGGVMEITHPVSPVNPGIYDILGRKNSKGRIIFENREKVLILK